MKDLDYPAVFEAKMKYIREAFMKHGKKDMSCAAYKKFIEDNLGWLKEYSIFCAKRVNLEPGYHCWMQ